MGVRLSAPPFSSHVFAWFNKFWWNLPTQPLFEFDWNPRVNQVNGSGLQWHPIFSDSVSHCEEAHGMYSKDVGGGQSTSLAFLWCPRPLWRCPPAPFTFEFLSRPNRSVVKYTLKSYEFMNFTQVYLSPSPYHQGESFLAQRQSCSL